MLITIGIAIVASLVLILLLSFNKEGVKKDDAVKDNAIKDDSVMEIANDYAKLLVMANEVNNKDDEKELMEEFSQLFLRISQGNTKNKEEYAQLLTEIMGECIPIRSDQVFSIAEELAQLYMEMAEGTLDSGIQRSPATP